MLHAGPDAKLSFGRVGVGANLVRTMARGLRHEILGISMYAI